MDDKHVEFVKSQLETINRFVSTLDPAVRSAAFELLLPLYIGSPASRTGAAKASPLNLGQGASESEPAAALDMETFFATVNHDKPHENVHQIGAWLYSRHGLFPITARDVRDIADRVGLTIPDRPDATMRAAKEEGKILYKRSGDGFQPTVHGERYYKTTYRVRKGTGPRLPADNE
jgi:hypothetical protein